MRELKKYLLLLPLILCVEFLPAQNQDLLKHFLTVENGLSNNEVTSIVQDHDGFIWIGTRGGLNRYDGYEFKIFNQIPGDTNSLVNPSVESLFVDSRGHVWIGSKSGGISKYDPSCERFSNIKIDFNNTNPLFQDNRYLCFFEDRKGQMWIGSWENGLYIYNEEKGTCERFLSGIINTFAQSDDGRIWVGTSNGLYAFNPDTYSYVKIEGIPAASEIIYDKKRNLIWSVASQTGLRKYSITTGELEVFRIEHTAENPEYERYGYHSVLLDKQDRLWVGTWGTGFFLFNMETDSFERTLIYPENRATFNNDYDAVLEIFEDKAGNVWLGTNGGGTVVLTPQLAFNTIGYHPEQGKGLSNTRVMSVVDDRNGNLWLGTIGGGLFWSPDRENFHRVPNNFFKNERFFVIKYLYEANDGTIWVGSNNHTFVIEFENGKPKLVDAARKYGRNMLTTTVVSFSETDDLFFVGFLQAGLMILDKKNNYQFVKRLRKSSAGGETLKSNRISALLKDSKNRLWAGTYNGLHVLDMADTSLVLAENVYSIEGHLTGNIITTLDEDQYGNIWVGTPNGLNRLEPQGEKSYSIKYYTEEDGLRSNFIKGISHDLNGNIWMSTNVGISKMSGKDELEVVNFDETDGVRGKNFTETSVFKNSKGEIFFGGSDGVTYFNPDEIVEQAAGSKPVFTRLLILNKEIRPNAHKKNSVLKKAIAYTNEIELSYKQNKIQIDFSALDYESAGKNHYKVFLENYDESWNDIGTRRFALFNNLKPGKYVLRVKSSNRHGKWNDKEASLKITVHPPIWQTWYALLFYILVVVGIVTVIRWNAVKQVQLSNSLEMEKMQHEQDKKLNEMKLRFFTNLSHEFRTPLTLILAPLKELIDKKTEYQLNAEAQNKIGVIQNNSKRLMKLVNQLLDFRKVESGNMKLQASKTNIDELVSEICYPFTELAKINNINFKINANIDGATAWVDRDKLEIVLNNLISNAFKVVGENDKIGITLFEEEDEFLLSVSDNGPGIPETEIDNIFDRFYRVGGTNGHGSSGIGLALAKRFVELHKGSISVVSKPKELTEFTVTLLKGTTHLASDEMIEIDENLAVKASRENLLPEKLSIKNTEATQSDTRILIVEDNKDVNDYLQSLLAPLYKVEAALNGAKGYEMALQHTPHLIISDVMMPQMDGFELCKQIRGNEKTANVPFIFLTAKSDEQFRLLGAQLGADDFISKPFDPKLVLQKVKNIVESRERLQKEFSKTVRLEPSDIEISSGDEAFVMKAIAVIEENLQNHKFNSEFLAAEMHMSNSSLYRKLKSLTSFSTAEFIRSIRIKRAAQLLADKQRTVTEIAYEVGFNDVKHFRAVFQKQFKCTPSSYRDKL